MKIVPNSTVITRAPDGKKQFSNDSAKLNNSDANTKNFPSSTKEEALVQIRKYPGYAIVPEDNLIVIDIDADEPYDDITALLIDEPETYNVTSDKGFQHLYYEPTPYFKKSPLAHTSRRSVNKVDILQNKSYIFGPGKLNKTKVDHPYLNITHTLPIPDILVDYLVSKLAHHQTHHQEGDYQPNTTYIGLQLIQALSEANEYLTNYREPTIARAWDPFTSIAKYLIPKRYYKDMDDTLHPDSIPHDVPAAEFIQATVAKLIRDPSISYEVGVEYLTLVTTKLWTSPISESELHSKIKNYRTQEFNGTKYSYNPALLEEPMARLNNGPYGKIYINPDSEFFVETPDDLVNLRSYARFKTSLSTLGCGMNLPAYLKSKSPDRLVEQITLVTLASDITKPHGLNYRQGDISIYNTYKKELLHNIVVGLEPEPPATIDDFPIFLTLLRNLTADHIKYDGEQEKLINNFLFFLSQKLKKLLYSPLIFQLNGIGGAGKGVLVNILGQLTGGSFAMDLDDDKFNAQSENMLWAQQSEIPVTEQNLEKLKAISGNEYRLLKVKFIDAQKVKNCMTIFVETNSDKVFIDPRRFVLFQSFTAQPWDYDKYNTRLQLELRRLCAYLRDIDISKYNPKILNHSAAWNGKLLEDTKTDRAESFGYGQDIKLIGLVNRFEHLSIEEFRAQLHDILGDNPWILYKKRTAELRIVLSAPGLYKDGQECPYNITISDMKIKGANVKRETNYKFDNFNKAYHYIVLQLPLSLKLAWEDAIETVEPLEV